MKLLDRYALRQLAGPLVWCLLLFHLLYLIIDLFGHLDEFLRRSVPPTIVAHYYLAMLPMIFVQIAPFAMLMAVLYTIGHMNRHQELIAMRASGVGPWHIIRPFLAIGFIMSALVLVVGERLVPEAAVTKQRLWDEYLDYVADPNQPEAEKRPLRSLAVHGAGQILVYAKDFDPKARTMADVVILEHGRNLKLRRKITAAKAEWDGSDWRFSHCTVIRFSNGGRIFGKAVTYDRKVIHLPEGPEALLRAEQQSKTMSYRELTEFIERLGAGSREAVRKFYVDLYAKLALPFASVVVVLLGAPLAVSSTRGGTLLGMGLAISAALAFYGVQAVCLALGKGGVLPPLLAAWGANLVFGALGIRLLRQRLT